MQIKKLSADMTIRLFPPRDFSCEKPKVVVVNFTPTNIDLGLYQVIPLILRIPLHTFLQEISSFLSEEKVIQGTCLECKALPNLGKLRLWFSRVKDDQDRVIVKITLNAKADGFQDSNILDAAIYTKQLEELYELACRAEPLFSQPL